MLKESTSLQISADSANQWLREALGLAGEDTPFPWQVELFTRFANGMIERPLDIPTGLGKTAVMAIWLVARACGGKLPRRLVYVVDRRAVVDQATEVAERLRDFVEEDARLRKLPDDLRALGLHLLAAHHGAVRPIIRIDGCENLPPSGCCVPVAPGDRRA